jgi:hypothetical protein
MSLRPQLPDGARMRLLFAFLFTGFAIIEVKKELNCDLRQNPENPEAIQFHSERLKTRQTPLSTVLNSPDGVHICIILNNL